MPVTSATQGLCDDSVLDKLAAACAAGPRTTDCVAVLAGMPSSCTACLSPFEVPFELHSGLWACVAASANTPCRRAMGCAADCIGTSCEQCLASSENQCVALVTGGANQCVTNFLAANACARNALEPGQLCSQFSYSDFGQWFRAVGDHFCGNGP
jgi:hypothetical protein